MDEIKFSLNKLLLKYDYLECYLEEINFKYSKYNEKFLKEYYELNPLQKEPGLVENEQPIKSEINTNIKLEETLPQETPIIEEPDLESNISEQLGLDDNVKEILNKLYKKLSLKTHPDKHGGNNELFIDVLNAFKSNNVLKLIRLANKYNIEVVISEEIINYIEKDIAKIESKINELQHHVCWLWNSASEDEKKKFKLP